MPTARELLEQADALMRRDRSPVADDIPVLTDSIGAVVPPRALRTRAPMAPPPQTLAPEESDTIPMLTDTVAAETPAASAIVAQEGEPSDWP